MCQKRLHVPRHGVDVAVAAGSISEEVSPGLFWCPVLWGRYFCVNTYFVPPDVTQWDALLSFVQDLCHRV